MNGLQKRSIKNLDQSNTLVPIKSSKEIAAEIANSILQLKNKAKSAILPFLVYFLEMSFQEAFTQANRQDAVPIPPKGKSIIKN